MYIYSKFSKTESFVLGVGTNLETIKFGEKILLLIHPYWNFND
jgi:hypothetical protein